MYSFGIVFLFRKGSLAQGKALDLVRRCHRQFRKKFDPAGVLERQPLLLHKGYELICQFLRNVIVALQNVVKPELGQPFAVSSMIPLLPVPTILLSAPQFYLILRITSTQVQFKMCSTRMAKASDHRRLLEGSRYCSTQSTPCFLPSRWSRFKNRL